MAFSFFQKIGRAIAGKSRVDDDTLDAIEEALIESDMGVDTTLKVIDNLEERASRDKYMSQDELRGMLREEIAALIPPSGPIVPDSSPYIILVVGVNGVGKTTTIGKLAYYWKSQGKKVLLGAADTFRAAAVDQLDIWAERAGVDIIKQQMGSDPAAVAYDTAKAAVARGADVVLIDTAGRLHNRVDLMNELTKIRNSVRKVVPDGPQQVLLVLDASTGQNAFAQAKEFARATDITGIVVTKLDGTAKGGVVLAIKEELDVPVKFIGVGEQVDDLQPFVPEEFAKALFADENTIEEAAKAEAAEENKAISEQTDDEAVQEEHIPATADIWAQIDAEAQAEKQSLAEDEEAVKQKELGEQKAREEAEKERQRKREERKSRAKKRNWSTDTTSSESTDTAGDDDWLKSWREGNGENK